MIKILIQQLIKQKLRQKVNKLLILVVLLFSFTNCKNRNDENHTLTIVDGIHTRTYINGVLVIPDGIHRKYYSNGALKLETIYSNNEESQYFFSFYDNKEFASVGYELEPNVWKYISFDSNGQIKSCKISKNDTLVYQKLYNEDKSIKLIERKVITKFNHDTIFVNDTVKYTVKGYGTLSYNEKARVIVDVKRKSTNEKVSFKQIGKGLKARSYFVPKDTGTYVFTCYVVTFWDEKHKKGFGNESIKEIVVLLK